MHGRSDKQHPLPSLPPPSSHRFRAGSPPPRCHALGKTPPPVSVRVPFAPSMVVARELTRPPTPIAARAPASRHASGRLRATPEVARQPPCPGSRARGTHKRGAARKPAPPDLRRDPPLFAREQEGARTTPLAPHSHFRAKGARAGKHPLLPAPPAPVCAQRERSKVPCSHANGDRAGQDPPPFAPTPLLAREREGAQTQSGAPPLTSAQERRANGRGAEWEGVGPGQRTNRAEGLRVARRATVFAQTVARKGCAGVGGRKREAAPPPLCIARRAARTREAKTPESPHHHPGLRTGAAHEQEGARTRTAACGGCVEWSAHRPTIDST
ncbi:hypothetical protein EDB84DRAFT_1437728 [Lactarius hengduanensis]|nr:hypothetical protein EDB84DRAFT_1437728 [Lactarius hengduanensis]